MDPSRHRKTRRSLNVRGHAHELTFSCHRRQPFLTNERTVLWLAQAIDRARDALDFDLWGYVFMPEHVHLLIHPRKPDYEVPVILKKIKWPVARLAIRQAKENEPELLRRLTIRPGDSVPRYRFWEAGGGYDRNIANTSVARAVVRYMHANPARRGLVRDHCEWAWSSARWYAGKRDVLLPIDPLG